MHDDLGIHYHSDAELRVPCPFCGSEAGERCTRLATVAGDDALVYDLWPHHSRKRAWALSLEAPTR